MKIGPFELHEFSNNHLSQKVLVHLEIKQECLCVQFEVSGPEHQIQWSDQGQLGQAKSPLRKVGLWNQTCFEFFMKDSQSSKYLEVNAVPIGDWNLFEFSDYRKDMREPKLTRTPRINYVRDSSRVIVEIEFSLKEIREMGFKSGALFGFTAILFSNKKIPTYWALKHCGTKPDFHLQESFVLNVDFS